MTLLRRFAWILTPALATGCSAAARVLVQSPAVPTGDKAPFTIAWAGVKSPDEVEFKEGWTCTGDVPVRIDSAWKTADALLQASFQRVVVYKDAPPQETDFIAELNVDAYNWNLTFLNPRIRDVAASFQYGFSPPFYATGAGACLLPFLYPVYARNVADRYQNYYEEQFRAALSNASAKMLEVAAKLSAYRNIAEQTVRAESEADAALAAGDKSKAFSALLKLINDSPSQSERFQKTVDKLLPLSSQVELPPVTDDHRRLMVQAQEKFKDGKSFDAIQGFEDLARQAPWWPAVWFNLGIAQEGARRYKDAAVSFRRYLAAAPEAADADAVKKRLWALEAK